jgi:hypothetical protein
MKRTKLMLWIGIPVTAVAIAIVYFATLGDRNASDRTKANGDTISYAWDLRTGHDISRVSWPKSVTDDIWFIDGPASFELQLPGEHPANYIAIKSQIRRERGQITTITMGFPSESLDAACERARSLIREWHIPDSNKLEIWYEKRRKDHGDGIGPNMVHLATEGTLPGIGLDVRPDYSEHDKWYTSILIRFPNSPGSP